MVLSIRKVAVTRPPARNASSPTWLISLFVHPQYRMLKEYGPKDMKSIIKLKVLRALGLKFDEEGYWKYMRGNCRAYLAASQDTREFLRSLSGQKYVFTNSSN